jgi:hypothetical protein
MDKDKNTMQLPTVSKTSISKSCTFDRGDGVHLLEYLRGEVLDVSKFSTSFSKAKVLKWKSAMPSATSHLVALLAHVEIASSKLSGTSIMLQHVDHARSMGFREDYFASLLLIVMPDDDVIAIVGHRLKEPTFWKEHNLLDIPQGTYVFFYNFNGHQIDKFCVKEIVSIDARQQQVQVVLEGDVRERTLPTSKVMPRGMYSERADGKSQRFPPSTSPAVPFPKSLSFPGMYHVTTLAELAYADISALGKATGISQVGATKGKLTTKTFGRRSRAKAAVFFKCPIVSVEATFPIAEAMAKVEAFVEARAKTGWCSKAASPVHLFDMWTQVMKEHPEMPPPTGGAHRLYFGGLQLELGLHPTKKTPERISGFQNYGAIHDNPTEQAMMLQGNDTVLFNPTSLVSVHHSIRQCVSVHDS